MEDVLDHARSRSDGRLHVLDDGIAGVDLALWDLAGKIANLPVSALLGANRTQVPAYLSGLPAGDPRNVTPGFACVKVFHDSTIERLLFSLDALPMKAAVDGLWRFTLETALELAPELEKRKVLWFRSAALT